MSNTQKEQEQVRKVDQLDLETQIVSAYTNGGEKNCRRITRGLLETLFKGLDIAYTEKAAALKEKDELLTGLRRVRSELIRFESDNTLTSIDIVDQIDSILKGYPNEQNTGK